MTLHASPSSTEYSSGSLYINLNGKSVGKIAYETSGSNIETNDDNYPIYLNQGDKFYIGGGSNYVAGARTISFKCTPMF